MNNIFRARTSGRGFTLIELMVVSAVYIGILVAIWGVLLGSLNHIALAKEVTIAADDLKDVMERIRSVPFSDLTTLVPDQGSVSESAIGGFLLQNESIVVSYPQGTDADPLEIRVELSWDSRNGRSYSRIIKTMRTRRL